MLKLILAHKLLLIFGVAGVAAVPVVKAVARRRALNKINGGQNVIDAAAEAEYFKLAPTAGSVDFNPRDPTNLGRGLSDEQPGFIYAITHPEDSGARVRAIEAGNLGAKSGGTGRFNGSGGNLPDRDVPDPTPSSSTPASSAPRPTPATGIARRAAAPASSSTNFSPKAPPPRQLPARPPLRVPYGPVSKFGGITR